ncbi:MAG: RNA polymerase factor sigma-32 [Chrysiogenetes bacterium]|nr:RNA polymerase factor sigma-32 [Chrysiogenetes bacterium]
MSATPVKKKRKKSAKKAAKKATGTRASTAKKKAPATGAKKVRKKKTRKKASKAAEGVRYEELEPGAAPEDSEELEEPSAELESFTDEDGLEDEEEGEESPALPAVIESGPSPALRDTLSSYMAQAQKYPLLTREEEHDLAVRLHDDQDQDAAFRLVTSNLRLVVKLAWEYRSAHKNLLDLVQEGNIGLMMAVKNFDPYKGVRLSSYAQYWIRAYMLRYIINNFHLVKLGTTQAQRKLFFNLRKEKARLEREGFKPTPQLLAKNLDVREDEVREMDARLTGGEVSMDMPLGDEGNVTMANFIPDEHESAEEAVAESDTMERFRAALAEYRKTLEERDAYIFDKRLIAEDPLTLEEIGNEFGVSKERARQLEERIKKNLKKFLDQRGQEFEI